MGRPTTKAKAPRAANRPAQAPVPNAAAAQVNFLAGNLPRFSLDDLAGESDEDEAPPVRRGGAKRERASRDDQEERIEQEDDDADEANDNAPESAAAPPRRVLRPRTIAATAASHQQALAAPPVRRSPRRVAGSIYADQQRVANHKRARMPQSMTDRMIDEDVANPDRTAAASAMAFDQALARPQGLRALGLSRNHLTADSNVASLVHMAAASPQVDADPTHLHHFLRTLGGDDGDEAVDAFEASRAHAANNEHGPAAAAKNRAIALASMGSGNIRFDDAARNEHQLHGYDHEFDGQGRITQRSVDNHGALLGLMHYPGMIDAAMNAAQPTIVPDTSGDVRRGAYLTSSGVARIGMQDPDAFAAPRPRPLRRAVSLPPPQRSAAGSDDDDGGLVPMDLSDNSDDEKKDDE